MGAQGRLPVQEISSGREEGHGGLRGRRLPLVEGRGPALLDVVLVPPASLPLPMAGPVFRRGAHHGHGHLLPGDAFRSLPPHEVLGGHVEEGRRLHRMVPAGSHGRPDQRPDLRVLRHLHGPHVDRVVQQPTHRGQPHHVREHHVLFSSQTAYFWLAIPCVMTMAPDPSALTYDAVTLTIGGLWVEVHMNYIYGHIAAWAPLENNQAP